MSLGILLLFRLGLPIGISANCVCWGNRLARIVTQSVEFEAVCAEIWMQEVASPYFRYSIVSPCGIRRLCSPCCEHAWRNSALGVCTSAPLSKGPFDAMQRGRRRAEATLKFGIWNPTTGLLFSSVRTRWKKAPGPKSPADGEHPLGPAFQP